MSGVITDWNKSSSDDTLGKDTNSTTSWAKPSTLPVVTSWAEPAISVPSTSWAEVLETFQFWADGNSFWEDINSNYEDL